MSEARQYDFLVIGSGVAGLTFALHACKYGSVALVTKKERSESNTNYAQGGIAAALGQDDDWKLHYEDTLTAGAGLCHEDAVELLVKEGPNAIRWLQSLGADFDQVREQLNLGREGGHSRNRIVHHADRTGWEIERTLLDAIKGQAAISVFEHYFAVDLCLSGNECSGAWMLDTETDSLVRFEAKAVLLATGGCGQVYRYTTNPTIATGDGVAMAWRAGASIADMEFIQFHPTTLYHPAARSFLVSEAVRGEGAKLIRANGERFMDAYHPLAELAPRDIVARAIDDQLKRHNEPCVYLDITHQPAEKIQAHFPTINERLLSIGIDMTKEPIPVVPAAHYSCGGVLVDLEGRTDLPRLYACGEVACTGVHGANRLASNSLLEALVFGECAATNALRWLKTPPADCTTEPLDWQSAPDESQTLREAAQTLMWKRVGIVRTDERLQKAKNELSDLRAQVQTLSGSVGALELRNLIDVAELIVECASRRKESRGLHYTLDYPERDDTLRVDTVLKRNQ